MKGGHGKWRAGVIIYSKDILMYDDNEDKWTKVGDLCHGRAFHAMSLVPAEVEDQCLFTIDC